MSDFGYTPDSAPPPGGRAWLDYPPVEHGPLWACGEWLLEPGNIEAVLTVVVVCAFLILVTAAWLVS